MKLRRRTVVRLVLAAAGLVLVAGVVAPFLDAGRFGNRVRASLREALGREVEIGDVHLDLFRGPGFSVDRVVIHEDPAVGLEPFAYVESLEATVSFKSFWTGRLEFSTLRLSSASINLVRPEHGRWNFEYLVSRTAGAAVASPRSLPELEVRGSRINFKFGDTKSILYISDARLDVTPPSRPGGDWRATFEGEPARTDRSSQGFGRFSARGRWRPDRGSGGQVDASIELQKSSLSDLIRLAHGHDIGVHGQVSSQARLSGPLANIAITGRMQIGDIHRWDLLPPHSDGWPLDFRGKLDMVAQTLRVATVPPSGGTLPVGFEFRASEYLSRPRWAALIKLDRLPFAPLPEVARHMGVELPPEVAIAGEVSGVIGYSPDTRVQGTVLCGQTSVTIPNAPPLQFEQARVRLDRDGVHLEPAEFQAGAETAVVEGEYSWTDRSGSAVFTAAGMSISGGEDGGMRLFAGVPVMTQATRGVWAGQLQFRKNDEQPGQWSGAFRLKDASFAVHGVAGLVEIASARVTLLGDGVAVVDRIDGKAGEVPFKGEYRYMAGQARPHQARLTIAKTSAAELEAALAPSLRREETLLARALRLGRTQIPGWLEGRKADIALQIGALDIADLPLENVRAHVRWDGVALDAPDFTARFEDGTLNGHVSANLRRNAPSYRVTARFRGVNWMGGKWDGRTLVQTAGTGAELLRNARIEGAFKARSIELAGDTEAKSVSGTYAFAMPRGLPVLSFPDLQMTLGDTSFKGKGATGNDGRLYLDLSDGQTQVRVTGTLSPLQLELASVRNSGAL